MQALLKKKDWLSHASSGRNKLYGVTQKKGNVIEYYFVLINSLKEAIFLKLMKGREKFKLTDFGEIVAKGYGKPSESLKEELRAKYNADLI